MNPLMISSRQLYGILSIVLLLLAGQVSAQNTRTWTGTVSSEWDNAFNWSGLRLPTALTNVLIPDVNTNDPIISTSVSIKSLTVESGGQLGVSSGVSLMIAAEDQDAIENDGLIDNEGTISINQTNTAFTINGIDNSGEFNNLADGIIEVDGITDNGIFNRNGAHFDNAGRIYVGATTAVGSSAVRNATGGAFNNSDCQSLIHLYSSEILGYGGFTNDGNIVEEAGSAYTSVVNTNNGVVQNLNGGDCLISSGNGIYDTLGLKIWRGCQSKNWAANNNWHDRSSPSANNRVLIPDMAENDVHVKTGIVSAQSVEVTPQGVLVIESNNLLLIDAATADGLYNEGSVTVEGTLMIGTLDTIGGNGIENYGTVEITASGLLKINTTTERGLENLGGTVTNEGAIIFDNTGGDAIYNEADFVNEGSIEIGQNGSSNNIYGDGIENESNFTNAAGASIKIDHTLGEGVELEDGSGAFTNFGTLEMGLIGIAKSIGSTGFYISGGQVRNEASGVLSISNTDYAGLFVANNEALYNAGQINIGQNGGPGNIDFDGVSIYGTITNDSTGNIVIDNTIVHGMYVDDGAEMDNFGSIDIGQNGGAENIGEIGIVNLQNFRNKQGASVRISNTVGDGINTTGNYNNTSARFANNGTLSLQDIGGIGIYNDAIFRNNEVLTLAGADSSGIHNAVEGDFISTASMILKDLGAYGIYNEEEFINSDTITIDSTGNDGIYNIQNIDNTGSISIDNVDGSAIYSSNSFINEGQIRIGQIGGNKNIKVRGLYNQGFFNNKANALLELDNITNYGIYNLGADAELRNKGTINIGQQTSAVMWQGIIISEGEVYNDNLIVIDKVRGDAIGNEEEANFVNDVNGELKIGINIGNVGGTGVDVEERSVFTNSGMISVDDARYGVYVRDTSVFINNITASFIVGQENNTRAMERDGIYLSKGIFLNRGGLVHVDNVDDTYRGIIMFDAQFDNTDDGEVNVGQRDGGIGYAGLEVYGSTFLNDGATLKIASVGSTNWDIGDGLIIGRETIFTNAGDGEIIIGNSGTGRIHNNGILLKDDGQLINQDSASIYVDQIRGVTNAGEAFIKLEESAVLENTDEASIVIGSRVNFFKSTPAIVNEASINNRGTALIDVQIDYTTDDVFIENSALGVITNETNATLNGLGKIQNEGGTINNAGTLSSNLALNNNSGSITNDGTISTNGNINNNDGGLIDGSGHFSYKKNWKNNGTFSGTGTVRVTGTENNSAVRGDSVTTFYGFVVDKSSGELTLENTMEVLADLEMIAGNLNLDGYDITLGTANGAIVGESASSYIYGSGGEIIKALSLNAPQDVNPGNLGVHISSSANFGTTTIRRGHQAQSVSGKNSITHYYHINPANNYDLDASLRFDYFDVHLNGVPEGLLAPYMSNNSSWDYYASSTVDTLANYLEMSGIDRMDTLTLAEGYIKAMPIVMLEGPFSGGAMNDNLRAYGSLPLTEPYTDLGYTHVGQGGGETADLSIFYNGNSDAIVDWVFLELRDKNDPDIVLHTRCALLQKDGDIVDVVDGASPVHFPGADMDDYYLAIHHRNHLAVMSANTISLSNVASMYDFSADPANSMGGLLGIADLGGGYYGLYSGDYDSNGQVQNTDSNNLIPEIGTSGYLPGDLDLNGEIQNTDLQNRLIPNIGKGVQFNY